MGAPYQLCPKGQRALKVVKPDVQIEDWPRPDKCFEPKLALSGGRPGLYLWVNPDGAVLTWHRGDVQANHNAHRREEPIKTAGNTSSYTELIPLDESHLLCIYDRVPFGWSAIPPESPETNSVWVIRIAPGRR